jgi:hypothetical protein
MTLLRWWTISSEGEIKFNVNRFYCCTFHCFFFFCCWIHSVISMICRWEARDQARALSPFPQIRFLWYTVGYTHITRSVWSSFLAYFMNFVFYFKLLTQLSVRADDQSDSIMWHWRQLSCSLLHLIILCNNHNILLLASRNSNSRLSSMKVNVNLFAGVNCVPVCQH